jgi:hypothetical protein
MFCSNVLSFEASFVGNAPGESPSIFGVEWEETVKFTLQDWQ